MATIWADPPKVHRPGPSTLGPSTLVPSKEEVDQTVTDAGQVYKVTKHVQIQDYIFGADNPAVRVEIAERSSTATPPETVVRKLGVVPDGRGRFLPFEKGVVLTGIIAGVVGIGLGFIMAEPIISIFSFGVSTLLAIHGLAVKAGE